MHSRWLLAALSLALLAAPLAASANTGADATILNVVTVDYSDASGTQSFSATASSTITVNLVEAAATVSGRPTGGAAGDTAANPAAQTVDSGETATYLYALTSNANGDDIYDLTIATDATSNVSGESVAWQLMDPDGTTTIGGADPAQATLGASVITAVPSATTLEFPGGTLDNVAAGDIVVVDGVDYLVSSVTAGSAASHTNGGGTPHSDAGTTTAEVKGQLVLAANTDGANAAPAFTSALVGELAREQVLMRVQVTAVATTAGTDGTVDHDVTVAPDGDAGATAGVQDVTTTFQGVDLTIQKDVRNFTQSGSFAATATGDPGETLEYRLTISNSGGDATQVEVTDAVPEYTTLVSNAYAALVFAQATLNGGSAVNITTTADDDVVEDTSVATGNAPSGAAGAALSFYVGAGNSDATNTGGSLVDSDTIVITYQVTID